MLLHARILVSSAAPPIAQKAAASLAAALFAAAAAAGALRFSKVLRQRCAQVMMMLSVVCAGVGQLRIADVVCDDF